MGLSERRSNVAHTIAEHLRVAREAALDLGLESPEGVRSGGVSDGDLTGALGVPAMDGLGAVGGHPHGRDEWGDLTGMPDRAALLAAMIDRLCSAEGESRHAGGNRSGPGMMGRCVAC